MLQDSVAGLISGAGRARVAYRWVPLEAMSPHLPLAVVAAEDQRFPTHHGFDLDAIREAIETEETSGRLRGASTLSQQVAKNLFLWRGRSWVRKALEAYFTVLIEALWPKRRILEVYLNLAQLGERLYGVGAAAPQLFRKPASALSAREAATLAATLPNPVRLRADSPSRYLRARVAWIERQMGQLGPGHLRGIL
jgi:monofunctional biosynthetic peptidoglycan transglycosylase